MHNIFLESQKDRMYTEIADKIGHSIRSKMIQMKKHKSLRQRSYTQGKVHSVQRDSTSVNFFRNSYKVQKTKWAMSQNPEFYLRDKQQILHYKQEQLKQFKRGLKSLLERKKQCQQIDKYRTNRRVQQMKDNAEIVRKEKMQIFANKKQRDADLLRMQLQKCKNQQNIQKRQYQLEQSFNRWNRHEQKLAKNRNKVLKGQLLEV